MFDLFRSRDKAVRILLGAILTVVALSMVTYLIPGSGTSTSGSAQDNVVAKVGDMNITVTEMQRLLQNALRQGQIPPSMMQLYVNQIIQQVITDRAMLYEAKRQGLQVSDEDINVAVQNQMPPGFFQDGKLVKKAELDQMLAQMGWTVNDMRADIARQLLVTRLRDIELEGTVVSPAEVEQEYQRRNEKVKVDYVILSPAKYQAESKVDEAAMREYYGKNKGQYNTPAKKSIAYLVFDPVQVENSIPMTDEDLRKEYTMSMEKWRLPERARARHILLKTDLTKKDDDPANLKIKAKAEELLKQVKGGADFAAVAKKNSEDTNSAVNGGELGWVVHGQMVKPFEEAVFKLKPGEISDLVKSQFGYHIVQVEEHEDPHTRSFEEVKPELAIAYRKGQVNSVMQKAADRALADFRRDPAHPEKAAADVNLPLQRADNLAAGDPLPQLGVSPQFEQAIESLKKGEVSQPVVVAGNKIAVALVTDVTPSHPASFEEAQSQIRTTLEGQKQEVVLTQKASDLMAKAKETGDLKKAAASMGLEVKTSADFDRNGAIEGVGSASTLQEAFSKPMGTLIGPIPAQGNRVIAKVVSHTQADMAAFATQKASIRDEIKSKRARERNTVFEAGLKEKLTEEGKIKIHQDVLGKLIANYKS